MQQKTMKLWYLFSALVCLSTIVAKDQQLKACVSGSHRVRTRTKGCGNISKKFCKVCACCVAINGSFFVNGVDYSTPTTLAEAISAAGLGISGPQGSQGIPGDNGTDGQGPILGYGYVYKTVGTLGVPLALNSPITFDSNGPLHGVTHVAGNPGGSAVTVTNSGIYAITFSVNAVDKSQFEIRVNNVAVAGGRYGTADDNQQNKGQAIVALNAMDVITIVNAGSTTGGISQAVDIGPATSGGSQTVVTASLRILRLAVLPNILERII